MTVYGHDDALNKVEVVDKATQETKDAEQDNRLTALENASVELVAGTGISIGSDNAINHSNSVTAKTTFVGSATSVPRIKFDSEGHITEVSTATIYPPTSPGTAGQVWTSDGAGAGIWADAPGGGEVWEEVDLSNFPTDWVDGDRIKVQFKMKLNWDGSDISLLKSDYYAGAVFEFLEGTGPDTVIKYLRANARTSIVQVSKVYSYSEMNNGSLFEIGYGSVSGTDYKFYTTSISTSSLDMIYKMWRLKQ